MNLFFGYRNKINIFWGVVLFLPIISIIFHGSVLTDGQEDLAGINNRDPKYYTNYEVLDKEGKYVLEWVVDWKEKRILFNVTVETRGYIGFGLSAKGLINGADIVIGGVTKNGEIYFSDRHGVTNGETVIDKSQDWQLHTATECGLHTFLSFSRAFDTCDEDDYPINIYDTVILIWSYGEFDTTSQLPISFTNVGNYPVYILDPTVVPSELKKASFSPGPPLPSLLAKENLKLWTMPVNYTLTSDETMYSCTMQKFPQVGKKYHLIGFNIRFANPESQKHVHHLIMRRCDPQPNKTSREMFDHYLGAPGVECFNTSSPRGDIPSQYCNTVKYAFFLGGRINFVPDHYGIAVGETLTDEYFVLQIHYDNPQQKAGAQIDIEIDIYYTDQLRKYDAGLMMIGQQIPGGPSVLVPPKSSSHTVFGHCGPTCTNLMFPSEGINIAEVVFYLNLSGKSIKVRHFRDNKELPWVSADNNFNNGFEPFRLLNAEVNILPTDQLTVACEYDNTWRDGTVVGGLGTSQEMCFIFVFYYNIVPDYTSCRSDLVNPAYKKYYLGVDNVKWSYPDLEFVATSPADLAGLTMSKISDTKVNWTKELRMQLQNDHKYMNQRDFCPPEPSATTGGAEEAGEDAVVALPRNVIEWQPPGRQCGTNDYVWK